VEYFEAVFGVVKLAVSLQYTYLNLTVVKSSRRHYPLKHMSVLIVGILKTSALVMKIKSVSSLVERESPPCDHLRSENLTVNTPWEDVKQQITLLFPLTKWEF